MELLGGKLTETERMSVECHLDRCPDCMAMLEVLAHFPPAPSVGVTSDKQNGSEQRWSSWLGSRELSTLASLLLLSMQVLWTGLLWQPAITTLAAKAESQVGFTERLLSLDVAIMGPFGVSLGVLWLGAQRYRSPLARPLRVAHSLAAMATLVLLPLAVVALVSRRDERHR